MECHKYVVPIFVQEITLPIFMKIVFDWSVHFISFSTLQHCNSERCTLIPTFAWVNFLPKLKAYLFTYNACGLSQIFCEYMKSSLAAAKLCLIILQDRKFSWIFYFIKIICVKISLHFTPCAFFVKEKCYAY